MSRPPIAGRPRAGNPFLKLGLYGGPGSGKTYTMAIMAIQLARYLKIEDRPIFFYDTEPGWHFVDPLFQKAGLDLRVAPLDQEGYHVIDRRFSMFRAFCELAREQSAGIVLVDSLTHIWRQMQEDKLESINADRKRSGRPPQGTIEMHQWNEIKKEWAWFTRFFLEARSHIIVCGRVGDIYEYQENSRGKMEMVKTNTKMSAEKETAYEPSLLIELRKRDNPDAEQGSNRRKQEIICGYVEKDRSNRLNGKMLDWPKFSSIKPHVDFLQQFAGAPGAGIRVSDESGAGDYTGDETESGWSTEKSQRTIEWEKILGELEDWHPGSSADAKKQKNEILWTVFRSRSKTELSEKTPSVELARGLQQIIKMRYPEEEDAIPMEHEHNAEEIPDELFTEKK